ncbi:family 16 glycosylhydrolase [Terrarubrum flagellatum]|uniref:family 16 glycosylhydrolase n=1 Tax=Terrirubrum flagellatum TaxID=2895980 RepID=UPI0031450112
MAIDPKNLAGTAKLTFSDEFNSFKLWDGTSGLDTRPAFAMSGTWADQGFAWSGASDTWYVQPNNLGAASNPFSVNNGVLTITASRSATTFSDPKGTYEYTSGVITTAHEFAQTYGYFEIRAKTSDAPGTLPAFWLLPADGSWPPELDVMEISGSQPTTLLNTAHSARSGAYKIDSSHFFTADTTTIANASAGFHTYGVDWEADKIAWYYDGQKVFETATPSDMNKPMYLVANLNVGGKIEGHPDASQPFSASYQIDYIRAYTKQTNVAAPVITSNGGLATAKISLSENNAAVTTVVATDADGQRPTYSIAGGVDAALFAIDATSGKLIFKSAPDHEAPRDSGHDNVYNVVVRASDGIHNDDQAIAVSVLDVNDNAPVITSNGGGAKAKITVSDHVASVTTMAASDADGDHPIFSISGGLDASLFTIDPLTGALKFKAAPNYATPTDSGGDNIYDVTVRASDGAHHDDQAISVSVSSVNKAPIAYASGTETISHYDAKGGAKGAETIASAVRTDGDKTVQEFSSGGHLKSADVVTDKNGKEIAEHYDSAWNFSGSDVITFGTKITAEHYDAQWKLASSDVFSMQNGKAVEEHYDALWNFTGADVGSFKNGKAVEEHYDSHWRLTGADVTTQSADKSVVEHYDAAWKLASIDVTTTPHHDVAQNPMADWLLGLG